MGCCESKNQLAQQRVNAEKALQKRDADNQFNKNQSFKSLPQRKNQNINSSFHSPISGQDKNMKATIRVQKILEQVPNLKEAEKFKIKEVQKPEINKDIQGNKEQELTLAEQNCYSQVIIAGKPLYMLNQKQMQQTLHKTIVALEVPLKDSMDLVYGSGVLLSRNIILTAAHNLFLKQVRHGVIVSGEQLNKQKCKVYLKGDGSKYFQVEDWVYLKQFTTALKKDQVQFDYGLIKLRERTGPELNTFLEVSMPCQCILNKKPQIELNIYGYPLKDQNYEPLERTGRIIKLNQFGLTKNDAILQVNPSFQIQYSLSTMPGQSGSPIVVNDKIIGIHTGGVERKFNRGRLIAKDLINVINNWGNILSGDPFRINQNASCPYCKGNKKQITIPNQSKIDSSNPNKIVSIKRQAGQQQGIQKQIPNEPLFPITDKKQLNSILHRSIVAIKGKRKDSSKMMVGSGVLLSKNMVLTAAHNLYDEKYQTQYQKENYRIYIQSDGLKYYQVEDWRFLSQYKTASSKKSIQFDYGLIKLKDNHPSPVPDQFLQLSLPCSCILNKNPEITLNIFGYPIYKNNFEPLDSSGSTINLCQYGLSKKNSIVQIQDDCIIKYAVSTLSGQSGCPIVVDDKIIAIHKSAKAKEQCNAGRLVTIDMVDNLENWCKQLGGHPLRINNKKCWHKQTIYSQLFSRESRILIQCEASIQKIRNRHLHYGLLRIKQRSRQLKEAQQYYDAAFQHSRKYEHAKAVQLFLKSLRIKERLKGKNSIATADIQHYIGLQHYRQVNYTKALEYYSLALEIKEKVKGKGCFQSANTLHNMGLVYDNQLNYTKALEYYSLALEIDQRVKGKGYFQSASTLNNMASVYDSQLNYTKALEYYSLALKIREKVKGKGCFQSAVTLNNMGFVYSSLSNHEAATQSFSSSLLLYEKYSRETDARKCAIQLAKSLKKLKKQAQLSQIAAKYGLAANEI